MKHLQNTNINSVKKILIQNHTFKNHRSFKYIASPTADGHNHHNHQQHSTSSNIKNQNKQKEEHKSIENNINNINNSNNNNNNSKKKNRPMVHLSSAPNVKFTGHQIGSSYPILPHTITPRKRLLLDYSSTNNHNNIPSYVRNGIVPSLLPTSASVSTSDPPQIIIHSDETIDKIRAASQLASQMLQNACQLAQQIPFITTNDIDDRIHSQIINYYHHYRNDSEEGSTSTASITPTTIGAYPSPLNYNHFPKSICCSINEVISHGIPDTRTLRDGDLLSIDISVYLNGVHGDNCASIIIGAADDNNDNANNNEYGDDEIIEQKQRAQSLITATKEAMYEAIQICREGTPLNQIGTTIHNVADQYGYRPVKCVHGHGIGSELHMLPQIKVRALYNDTFY